jgi:hypothetical protein
MKTHILILFFCFSLVFFTEQVFAADFPGSKTVVAYVQPNQGNSYYAYGTFGIDIGYKYVSEAGESEKARTKFTFDLTTIPGNAEIISVQLSYFAYSYVNSSYKFKLTQIGNYNSPQEIWQNIGQAASLFTDVAYASGSLNNATLTSMVNSSKGSYLYIGALSQNENNTDSRANLDLTLNVQYSVPPATVNITADNNFIASGDANRGTMVIDGVNRTIPLNPPGYTFQKNVGQTLTLSANSPQNDNQNHQRIWHTGLTFPSDWRRNGVYRWPNQTYSFTVATDDNNKTYMANLRKNFKIDQTHKTEFDGNQTQQNTAWIVELNSDNISTQSSRLINGKNYLFAGWEDNLTLGTSRNITPNDNKVYDVLYKYPHYSNTSTAYANPNQRRFVKSSAGYFHMVYESMGKIWYERKFGESGTWVIMNGGKPLNDGLGKYPSIDCSPNSSDQVIIVYWEESSTSPAGSKIIAHYFDNSYPKILKGVVANDYLVVHEDSQPVVSISQGGFILVAFNSGSIVYRLGRPIYTDNLIYWDTPLTDINWGGEFIEFKNPTIGSSKSGTTNSYWIAWDDNNSSIKFKTFTVSLNPPNDYYITEGIGGGFGQAGFSKNEQPSISVMPNNDFRISWFGSNGGAKQVVTYFNYQFYIFGTNVSSHSMSATDDGKAIIAYGDNGGASNKFRQVWYWGTEKNLGTIGKQTHLSNGSSTNNLYAMSFQNVTLPYSFSMSANLGSLQKVTEIPIACGRKGIVAGDSAEFYFTLGDVTLDGNTIDFIPTGINPDFTNLDTLNYYLSTQKFNVTNSSQFNFSIEYGVTDSLKAVHSLAENEYVKFKLQLINANTNNVIGEYTVVNFTKQNVIPYYGESFSINTNGIGNKKVRVRIVVEENLGGEYAMANISAEENVLPKQNQNVISYSGSEVVTEYALEQNYPNPFNPTTTIKYQIPTSGNVTIKVYDILGNEVARLVDGYMETGKYEVDFDASSLVSGVYIYRLYVNDYVNVKKMVLLK